MVLAQWFERGLGQLLAPDTNYEAQPDRMDTRSDVWQAMAPDPMFPQQHVEDSGGQRDPPPRRVLDNHKALTARTHVPQTTQCVHCQLETPILIQSSSLPKVTFDQSAGDAAMTPRHQTPSNKSIDKEEEPKTVFLSPTPKKGRSGRPSTGRRTPNPQQQQQQQQPHVTQEEDQNNNEEEDDDAPMTDTERKILQASHDTFQMRQRNMTFRDQANLLLKYCSSSQPVDPKHKSINKVLTWNEDRLKATHYNEPNALTQARSWGMGMACPDGYTPLMGCAKANQVKLAKRLLQHAAELNCVDEVLQQTNLYGQTALHIAAAAGQLEMAELLQKPPTQAEEEKERNDKTNATPTTPSSTSTEAFFSPQLATAQDVTGLTAWDAVMTSPNPKAKRNQKKLDRLLSSASTTKATPGTSSRKQSTPAHYYYNRNGAARSLGLAYATAHLDGRRVYNEDAVLCQPLWLNAIQTQCMLFCVCDGHGDSGSVAHFVAQHLAETLIYAANAEEDTTTPDAAYWTRVCQAAAVQLDVDLKQAHVAGGSTAVWALVTETQIVVANVGDSRCLLLQQKPGQENEEQDTTTVIRPMSYDHKPDLPEEQARIEQAGLSVVPETFTTSTAKGDDKETTESSIAKVQLSETDRMGLSRSFGDFEYKTVEKNSGVTAVICTPDVQVVSRQPEHDMYLVLACDGVWDVQTNEQVAEFILSSSSTATTATMTNMAAMGDALLQECLHSGDNLSLILVSFTKKSQGATTPAQQLPQSAADKEEEPTSAFRDEAAAVLSAELQQMSLHDENEAAGTNLLSEDEDDGRGEDGDMNVKKTLFSPEQKNEGMPTAAP